MLYLLQGSVHRVFVTTFRGRTELKWGYGVAQLVEALCCYPESRGFDFLWDYCDFHCLNPFGRTQELGLTQTLTGILPGKGGWRVW